MTIFSLLLIRPWLLLVKSVQWRTHQYESPFEVWTRFFKFQRTTSSMNTSLQMWARHSKHERATPSMNAPLSGWRIHYFHRQRPTYLSSGRSHFLSLIASIIYSLDSPFSPFFDVSFKLFFSNFFLFWFQPIFTWEEEKNPSHFDCRSVRPSVRHSVTLTDWHNVNCHLNRDSQVGKNQFDSRKDYSKCLLFICLLIFFQILSFLLSFVILLERADARDVVPINLFHLFARFVFCHFSFSSTCPDSRK